MALRRKSRTKAARSSGSATGSSTPPAKGSPTKSGRGKAGTGGMVALLAAPVVEQRFDAAGATWDLADLDKQVGSYFEDRDPAVCFAADSGMKLEV